MNEKSSDIKILKYLEIALIAIIGFLSVMIPISDFLGILDNSSWISSKIDKLVLLVVGLIAGYLILERRRNMRFMENEVSEKYKDIDRSISTMPTQIINSLGGVEFTQFSSEFDTVNYMIKRLREAKESVDDLTWCHRLSLEQHLPLQKDVEEKYQDTIKRISNKIKYREIFIFSESGRFTKLKRRISENNDGYSCVYYKQSGIPTLQYLIIDKKEVIFLAGYYPNPCSIIHEDLAQIFCSYFEEAWNAGIPLKTGSQVNEYEIQNIFAKME